MRAFAIVITVLLSLAALGQPVRAQDTEGQGYLVRLIQDQLSDAGRVVRISGFTGALSASATLQEMTIADADGVWLTLRDATLDWNRSALLRGRLSVNALTAGELEITRWPAPQDSALPSAEAPEFRLPELPVSVEVGAFSIGRVVLGAPILGQPVALRIDGAMTLGGGAGDARLTMQRLDGPEGSFEFGGAFSNATTELTLDLRLHEAADGLAVTLLGIPDRPAIDMTVNGAGPLSAFAATLALDADGTTRLRGSLAVRDGDAVTGAVPERLIVADLSGDISALVTPELRPFFGSETALEVNARLLPDGGASIPSLRLTTRDLELLGRAEIAADGLPSRVDLTGRIADATGAAVRLPVPGTPLLVDSAALELHFNAEQGNAWAGAIWARQVVRGDLSVADLSLNGTGEIARTDGGRSLSATLTANAVGLLRAGWSPGGPVVLRTGLQYRDDARLQIRGMTLTAPDLNLAADASLAGLASGLELRGKIDGSVSDLGRYAALVGRPLAGGLTLSAIGQMTLLSGAFEGRVTATGDDLQAGIGWLDALIAGASRLEIAAARDETGTRIDRLSLQSPALNIAASGAVRPTGSTLKLSADMPDLAPVLPGARGPASLSATAVQGEQGWDIVADVTAPGGAELHAEGVLQDPETDARVDGQVQARVTDLAAYAGLAGRPVAGALSLTASGQGALMRGAFEGQMAATGTDLRAGIGWLDALIAGASRLEIAAARDETGTRIDRLALQSPALNIAASGAVRPTGSTLELSADLPDLAPVLPGARGPASLTATAVQGDEGWDFVADVTAPGGAELHAEGRLEEPEAKSRITGGQVQVSVADLRPYAGLAGRTISGAVTLGASGSVGLVDPALDVEADLTGTGMQFSVPMLDEMIRGSTRLTLSLAGPRDALTLRLLVLDTGVLSARAEGDLGARPDLRVTARLADTGVLAKGLTGAIEVSGRAALDASGGIGIVAQSRGPGTANATVGGRLNADFSGADMTLSGQVPLALAAPFIAPIAVSGDVAFDLALRGPLRLASLQGTLTTGALRVALPNPALNLGPGQMQATLRGGQATLSGALPVNGGGRIGIDGSLGLGPPFASRITLDLTAVRIADPELYETTASGELFLAGPLAGGAVLTGTLTLGRTELQIPAAAATAGGPIPDIAHVGVPVAVRATLARAGLLVRGAPASGKGGIGLDLMLVADSQIFLRGRGLDAELGGRLRLGGSTASVVPSGRFDLIRGRLDLLGKRFVLNEGQAQLRGAFLPWIRLVAISRSDEFEVSIVIEGPAEDPVITFQSQPELPEEEVMSRLLFGRGIGSISAFQAAQLAAGVAALSGGGSADVLGRVRRAFNLDDLDVSSGAGGSGASVRAGRYISDNLYSDVVVGAGRAEISLNLDLTRHLRARGTLGSDGNSGIGLFYERDY